jgi:hypothetical protein
VRGQVEAVERALENEKGCAAVLHLIVAARGAMNSLMTEDLPHCMSLDLATGRILTADRCFRGVAEVRRPKPTADGGAFDPSRRFATANYRIAKGSFALELAASHKRHSRNAHALEFYEVFPK